MLLTSFVASVINHRREIFRVTGPGFAISRKFLPYGKNSSSATCFDRLACCTSDPLVESLKVALKVVLKVGLKVGLKWGLKVGLKVGLDVGL